jgi:hypothetical protein
VGQFRSAHPLATDLAADVVSLLLELDQPHLGQGV